MTPTMTSPTATAPEARKKEFIWTVEMPKEIAEAFGVAEGLPVTLRAQSGRISTQMDLTAQTAEAHGRDPGWFIELPAEAAAISGFADGSYIGVYAKSGVSYVEMIPPPSPEWGDAINQILDRNKEAFEELKRLGD